MIPRQHVSLRDYSTMRLGGTAEWLVVVHSNEELMQAVHWAKERKLPSIMIGSGSNIIWRDEGFPGLVIINQLLGYEDRKEAAGDHSITIGAGEIWDSVVERAVAAGLTGTEALSLIPGTAGATPVQNVGAYGQEIANTLLSVQAYDATADAMVQIPTQECGFGYRTSRFKTSDKGRFYIASITLRLREGNPTPPFYPAVERYFAEHNITSYTPQTIRGAVIAIRSSKLPDPRIVANNGSFFANPIISKEQLSHLLATYPDIPHWPATADKVKVPAAWLIEQAGFKDYHDEVTGMATWHQQPLVFVNEHAKSTNDLLQFRQKIMEAIDAEFGIKLEQEPELLP